MILRRTPSERGIKIELMLQGAAVSRVSVIDLDMRIGDASVRCGGIGDVYTERAHRRKGYARRVLEESLAFMVQEGYHLSALFGIPDLYSKFGFAPALIESRCTVATRDAETAQSHYAVRAVQPQDMPAIAEMYERMRVARTASVVRKPATWAGFPVGSRWSDRVSTIAVVDKDKLIGYAAYESDPRHCTVTEIGYLDGSVFSTLLAAVARIAVERRVERIVFGGPPDDPFLQYCHRYGCEIEIVYPRNRNGMARIIDQPALLEAIYPLFLRRLQRAGLADWSGVIALSTDLGTDHLRFGSSGEELAVEMPQWMLAQLLLGYRSVEDALLDSRAHIDEEAIPALRAIFPQGYPYIWRADRF